MGFWKKLFGLEGKKKAKLDVFATDRDGDGKVQDGTIWERPADLSVDLDATLAKAEELLKTVAPTKKPAAKKAPAKKPTTKKATTAKKAPAKKAPAAKTTTKKAQPKKK